MEKRNVVGTNKLKFMVVNKLTNQVLIATESETMANAIFKEHYNTGNHEVVELLDELGYRRY